MGVARLSPPFVGGLGCNCPRGVHDDPSDEAPEVEDIGEDEPSRMGGESAEAYCAGVAAPVLEAAKERGVAPDSDLDELGTVDKIDVVDKSENKKKELLLRFYIQIWIIYIYKANIDLHRH